MKHLLLFENYISNKLIINRNGEIRIGSNYIFNANQEITFSEYGFPNDYLCSFNVVEMENFSNSLTLPDYANESNSLFMQGGFNVEKTLRKSGIGTTAIKMIFEAKPDIEHIYLYALDWQGAVPFWHKIGGKTIAERTGLHLIELNRNIK